ncbi:D-alanyl-D-alanine carboxypeptidase DacB precursor [bacterium BMS3Abin15]|nr:D-alanyl-D-alanine carboxypeptidase DacB precursor [bacterium BMS3Abin15]HDZ84938.1 D-alanyl-D-alanine carboxypeptidase [Candidatus Moranbacteria bacterium]
MNFILIILTLTFPLASFLGFQKMYSSAGEEKQAEISEKLADSGGEVKGENIAQKSVLPVVPSRPIRKEGYPDLVVPDAHASLILDVDSGTILHYNKGRERRQIASLTKLMTAVIVVEKMSNLDEVVTVDEEAVYADGTKVGCPRSGYCIGNRLKVGEKITARNLLKAMLMNSANDAAIALGKHISGSQEKFARLMNDRAKELGLKDSNFCTPSGLEIDGKEKECYSSAYDIARIAAHSMKYAIIWEALRLPPQTIFSADGKYSHDILNTDQVLDQIPNCLGGKTGFTPMAGRSLLLAAGDKTGEHKIIAVVLDNPYRWQDIPMMISWAFEAHEWQ